MRTLFALFRRYRIFLLFIALELLSFSMLVSHNSYQNAVFFNSANQYVGGILSFSKWIQDYFALSQINQDLAQENKQLRKELSKWMQKNTRDTSKIDINILNQYDYVLAKVVNNSTHKTNNYITIDKGKLDGIQEGMAVISPLGIVGKVRKSNQRFSTVLSLLHSKMTISAQLKKNNELGRVVWDGKSPKFAKMLDVPKQVNVVKGDTVVSSGYSATFPPNVMIGIVKSVKINPEQTFYDIELALSTHFNSLHYVYVVKNILKIEQDSLEMETYQEIEE